MSSAWRSLFRAPMLVQLVLGFVSGLPLLLTGSTLQAWMKSEGVDLSTIGAMTLVGLPYTLKFLWSPLFDRFVPPLFGRRRGFMLITMAGLIGSLVWLASMEPGRSLQAVALAALAVTFFSASQDIVLDAYRREALPENEIGLGTSVFVTGYRLGLLAAGGLALILADLLPWRAVYLLAATVAGLGPLTALLCREPDITVPPPRTFRDSVWEPLREFFVGREAPLTILAFILFYKLGDQMASAITTPFFLELGFSKTEVGALVKSFGLAAMLLGGLTGGLLMVHWPMRRSLWVFGVLQAASTLGFALLALTGPSRATLAGVIAFENLTSGMGTAAYAAFMATQTNRRFTATQYALLSSLTGIPRVLFGAPTGWLAAQFGWFAFFGACALVAIPGLLLIGRLSRDGDDGGPGIRSGPSSAPGGHSTARTPSARERD